MWTGMDGTYLYRYLSVKLSIGIMIHIAGDVWQENAAGTNIIAIDYKKF